MTWSSWFLVAVTAWLMLAFALSWLLCRLMSFITTNPLPTPAGSLSTSARLTKSPPDASRVSFGARSASRHPSGLQYFVRASDIAQAVAKGMSARETRQRCQSTSPNALLMSLIVTGCQGLTEPANRQSDSRNNCSLNRRQFGAEYKAITDLLDPPHAGEREVRGKHQFMCGGESLQFLATRARLPSPCRNPTRSLSRAASS